MNIMKRLTISIMAIALSVCIISTVSFPVLAQNGSEPETTFVNTEVDFKDIEISATNYIDNTTDNSNTTDKYGSTAFLWESGKGTLSYEVEVSTTAVYNLMLTYATLKGNGMDIEIGITVDGKLPFDGADSVHFSRIWQNAVTEWKKTDKGDDITPEQVEYEGVITSLAMDDTGVKVDPYEFELSKGKHIIQITACGEPFVFIGLTLKAPEVIKNYKEIAPNENELKSTENAKSIIIEGENAIMKTSASILPKYDNTNVAMSPSSATSVRLNYLGGGWSSANSQVSWEFEAKTSGYYKIGFHFRQSEVINGVSYRWLKIDGKTPFAEAKRISFPYDSGWQFNYLSDGEEPCYVYLEKGKHTLTMLATLGDIASYYERLSKITASLGDEYTKIVWITGDTPDAGRDYELFNAIPDFEKTLEANKKALDELADDMQKLTGKKSSQYIASMRNMARVLRLMLERPYIAHQYLSDYYSNYCTVTAWLNEMAKMPLSIDQIQLTPANNEFDEKHTNIFEDLGFTLKRFLYSFTASYEIKKETNDKSIRLWVNWGRDQTQALQNLVSESFTAEKGIDVKVEMVNATLIQGVMSGNAPDVCIQQARTTPVNLGIRNALYDLKQFSDYEDVLKRFQKGAEIPYCYDGKCYALPDTQTFFSMFYRTDVLKELELEVPKTWDEFIQASIVIQRKNMQAYIPYTKIVGSNTVNVGIGNLNLYPTLLMQNGLSIYDKDHTAAAMNNPEAIKVFEEWIELYTDYKFLKEADFYNRFRAGTVPLGIASYSTYLTISQTAPEIEDKWDIAPVPAIDGKNGSIAGGGTGCAILSASEHKEEAWEFLKWWTSAKTQERYSKNVESILGVVARVATSNIEAFSNLSWKPEAKEKLLHQWESVTEVPEIPGSYYVARALDQAFWQVVNDESNSVDAVNEWNEIANYEIERKIKEYESLKK